MTLNPIKRDLTVQEILVAEVLSELKLRYDMQVFIGEKYLVDFLIFPNMIVIEADGPFGHFRQVDKDRDLFLLGCGITKIIHLREQRKEDVKLKLLEQLWLE